MIKSFKKLCPFFLSGLLLVLLCRSTYAEQTIRLVMPEFKPYTYSEGNTLSGIGFTKVETILKKLNATYEIKAVPNYGRALAEVKSGRADGFFLASQNDERDKIASFTYPLMINRWCWYSNADSIAPSNGSFKKSAKVGTILNTNTHKWLLNNNYNVTYANADPSKLLDVFNKNRVDAIFLAEAVFNEAKAGFEDFVHYNMSIQSQRPFGVYLSNDFVKKRPDFLNRFNKRILELKRAEQANPNLL